MPLHVQTLPGTHLTHEHVLQQTHQLAQACVIHGGHRECSEQLNIWSPSTVLPLPLTAKPW